MDNPVCWVFSHSSGVVRLTECHIHLVEKLSVMCFHYVAGILRF